MTEAEALRLPISSLKRKLRSSEDREKRREREWMVGMWAGARTIFHALTADGEMPRTSKDKPASEAQILRAKRWREEHDEEYRQGLRSPAHWGQFIGMPHIMGEPPKEEVQAASRVRRDEQRAELEDFKRRFLEG